MLEPAGTIMFHCRLRIGLIGFIAVIFCLTATLPNHAGEQGKSAESATDAEDSSDWIFDDAPYINKPKTGDRVDQFKKEKTPYRDPYAVFDSPMGAYPFEPDSYDSFFYGYPYYSWGFCPAFYPYLYGARSEERRVGKE